MLSVKNFMNISEGGGGGGDSVKVVHLDKIIEVEPCVFDTDTVAHVDPFVKAVSSYSLLSINTTFD